MKKALSKNAIKEAFNNLPAGICYFTKSGFPVLCNRQMHNIIYVMTGEDLQWQNNLTEALDKAEKTDGGVILLQDGTAWQFISRTVLAKEEYTQYIAADVTELYRKKKDLEINIAQYGKMVEDIKGITENVVAITREKEILTMKMNIHNDVGVCLQRLRQFYNAGDIKSEKDEIVNMVKNVADMLHGEIGKDDGEDIFKELLSVAKSLGVDVVLFGDMPKDKDNEAIVVEAIRECITNTLKHAKGDKLFVELNGQGGKFFATITNNGKQPEGEIVEGGGLSSLRSEVEQAGGRMKTEWTPRFKLIVELAVPDGR